MYDICDRFKLISFCECFRQYISQLGDHSVIGMQKAIVVESQKLLTNQKDDTIRPHGRSMAEKMKSRHRPFLVIRQHR